MVVVPGRYLIPTEVQYQARAAPAASAEAPASPLPEIAAQTCRLPNGALLIELLDDPAAVDPIHYQDIHTRWLQAP